MKKYFAWFFFVSGVIGLAKMITSVVEGSPQGLSAVELWSGWIIAFFVNALFFYLWDRNRCK